MKKDTLSILFIVLICLLSYFNSLKSAVVMIIICMHMYYNHHNMYMHIHYWLILYIKHSFCLIGTFMSAYSSHSYGVSPLNINTSFAYAIVNCFDVGVSSSPSNKSICSFLVHFLLLLAIETSMYMTI